jgi:hypothetical protein
MKLKLNLIRHITLEIQSRARGHNGNGKGRFKIIHKNIDNIKDLYSYKQLNNKDKRIHQGFNIIKKGE